MTFLMWKLSLQAFTTVNPEPQGGRFARVDSAKRLQSSPHLTGMSSAVIAGWAEPEKTGDKS
jgi:hypothetical protein